MISTVNVSLQYGGRVLNIVIVNAGNRRGIRQKDISDCNHNQPPKVKSDSVLYPEICFFQAGNMKKHNSIFFIFMLDFLTCSPVTAAADGRICCRSPLPFTIKAVEPVVF